MELTFHKNKMLYSLRAFVCFLLLGLLSPLNAKAEWREYKQEDDSTLYIAESLSSSDISLSFESDSVLKFIKKTHIMGHALRVYDEPKVFKGSDKFFYNQIVFVDVLLCGEENVRYYNKAMYFYHQEYKPSPNDLLSDSVFHHDFGKQGFQAINDDTFVVAASDSDYRKTCDEYGSQFDSEYIIVPNKSEYFETDAYTMVYSYWRNPKNYKKVSFDEWLAYR